MIVQRDHKEYTNKFNFSKRNKTVKIKLEIPKPPKTLSFFKVQTSGMFFRWSDSNLTSFVHEWFYGVMVSTQDSESCDPSSNLGRTCVHLFSK